MSDMIDLDQLVREKDYVPLSGKLDKLTPGDLVRIHVWPHSGRFEALDKIAVFLGQQDDEKWYFSVPDEEPRGWETNEIVGVFPVSSIEDSEE